MSYLEVVEYPICDLNKKKHFICDFAALANCSSIWEPYDRVTSFGIGRKIKSNLSDRDIENVKIRDGVIEFINNIKKKGLTLTMVTELSASDLFQIIKKNNEIHELNVFNAFNDGIVTNDSDWNDAFSKINLFTKALDRNKYNKEDSIALTSSLHNVKSAQNAGLQVVAFPTEENIPDSELISKLVDYYDLNIREFTKRLYL